MHCLLILCIYIFTFLVVNFAHEVLKGLLFNNELNYLLIVLKDLCFFSVEISHILPNV